MGDARMKEKAFFLDRDGTINVDRVYINDPRLIELIPGAGRAIRRAREHGYRIVVVTNQSGVGRGIIDPLILPAIHARLDELLAAEGAKIDLYQVCVHAPQEHCGCRKPSPALVEDAAKKMGIDLARSVFVGDKLIDVTTGKNARVGRSVLVRTGKGAQEELLTRLTPKPDPLEIADFVADDLAEAVDWVLSSDRT
jgi:histidinol-phosphate phosphatase family protein